MFSVRVFVCVYEVVVVVVVVATAAAIATELSVAPTKSIPV